MSPIKPENRNRYPANWKEISQGVKAKAAYECQCSGECGVDHSGHCGVRHGSLVPKTTRNEHGVRRWYAVVLTVAHYPDHDPANCSEDNLMALCQRCHNRLDAPERARNRAATRRRKKEEWQLVLAPEEGGA